MEEKKCTTQYKSIWLLYVRKTKNQAKELFNDLQAKKKKAEMNIK